MSDLDEVVEAVEGVSTFQPRKREKRMGAILEYLLAHSPSTVEELTEQFGVSAMTIYRDIADLEADSLVVRNHGEVSAAASTLVESSARLRIHANVDLKRKLAEAALAKVHRGNSLFLDDSTTNLHLFPDLAQLSPLTVITNARFIAKKVVKESELRLVSTGGDYIDWADAYFGPLAVQTIRSMRADLCIMSSSAVRDGYCFHPDVMVAEVKRAMLEAAEHRILVVDHSKFSRTALHRVDSLDVFDVVITDSLVSSEVLEELKSSTVEVVIVDQ